MIIRNETPKDFDEIYALIKTAFETSGHCDGDEQDFAVKLRNGNGYIPDLAFVAEKDNFLIGHIMLSKTYVATEKEQKECLLLSPLCVALEYRKMGVGAVLVNTALAAAKKLGYKAVFLCGDLAYYGRFGFICVSNYTIKPLMDIPIQYVLVCQLQQGWLDNIEGTINIV